MLLISSSGQEFQSTHSMRSATTIWSKILSSLVFQSAHSVWSATKLFSGEPLQVQRFQSTHSMRSATLRGEKFTLAGRYFNPRTPCGVRPGARLPVSAGGLFQSTHSMRSATLPGITSVRYSLFNFNPRTPCGVRPTGLRRIAVAQSISIHALHAECDLPGAAFCMAGYISIHALHAECDYHVNSTITTRMDFNPRTPCGVRLSDWQAMSGTT